MNSTQSVLDPSTELSTFSAPLTALADSELTTFSEPQSLLRSASSAGTGLKGEYYSGKNFETLKLTRTDNQVNFDWANGSPDGAIAADNFSVRWTGKIQPKYSETYTFYTTSDDGMRLWVNGQQLINNWTDHAATENRGSITLEAGKQYDIKLEYYENGGQAVSKLLWSSPSQSKEVVPQAQLLDGTVPPSTGTGLTGEYYSGKNFETLKLTRTDNQVNFDWANGSPDGAIAADNFSVRWTGKVQPKYSETYTFYTTSDDGMRLWVNGQQLINNWTDHAATENRGSITLEAGKQYDIKLEYYENGGGAVSKLLWSSPSQSKEVIPQSQLFTATTPTPPPPAPAPSGTGLLGQYYSGRNFDTLKLTRTDSQVNFDWVNGSPDGAIATDNFSVRWTGKVQPKYSETYTFYTTSDDGMRLWVNGQQLINNWTNHAATENQGSITLEAGKQYDIKLEYYENSGQAVSKLLWSSPSQSKEVIPQSQLFAGTAAPAPSPDGNDKPVIIVPGPQAIAAGAQLAISGLKVSDPDAGTGQLTMTLTATRGTLTVNGSVSGGVTMANIQNNGTSSVVLMGTLMQISATLMNPSGLLYAANSGLVGSDTVQVSVNDNGNTGSGGPQTGTNAFNIMVSDASNTPARSTIGTNLGGLADWSTQWPFVDMFKTSRDWIAQRSGAGWGQGGTLKLTPEGWLASLEPGQYAETIMMIDSTHYPAGQYTLLYEGDGKITFGFENAKILSQSPGRMVVDVNPNGQGVFLQIRETNPSNPIRNIRFIMPGFENTYQSQPFHPLFLERLSQFSSLRFMDWMATNNSDVVNWSDRHTLNSARQAGEKGIALEYMIQLANTLKIDPWFNIPAKASDDYVRQFATMVRDRLDPSLKAHIEYSNEVWNSMFEQSGYAAQQGMARNLDSNSYTAALRYYSERSVEVFNIVDQVYGTNARNRVVRVLAGQAANPWTAQQILGWKDAYKKADAYAIAPYFDGVDADKNGQSDLNDPARANAILRMTPDQIIDSFLADIPSEMKPIFDNNYNVATKQYGLPLYAYEGGPHLTAYQFPESTIPQITELFAQANRHPRMRDVYREYLNQWQQSGGTLFNQFVDVAKPSKWGFWGSMEYQNQDLNQAPKYQGLIDFINANPS